uniref:Uncharacterized protein n=1 Tax=Nymphaea colorata TaxID=210225 RepID=A0A5K1ERD9_9MAGN|nr:unnamed protein product [Nymphaea colorata]
MEISQAVISCLKKGILSKEAYVHKAKMIAHQLATTSKPVDEDDLVLYILNGLPSEYVAFRTRIETRKEAITLNELHRSPPFARGKPKGE